MRAQTCRKMFETTTHRLEWSITTRVQFSWNVCSCYRCGRSFKTQQSKVIRLGFPLHLAPCVWVGVGSQVRHCTSYHFSPMSLWAWCEQQNHLLAMLEDSCVHETSWVESNLRTLAVCKVWNPSFREFVQVGDHTIEQNSKKPVPRI